jgi:hypothetical protein
MVGSTNSVPATGVGVIVAVGNGIGLGGRGVSVGPGGVEATPAVEAPQAVSIAIKRKAQKNLFSMDVVISCSLEYM